MNGKKSKSIRDGTAVISALCKHSFTSTLIQNTEMQLSNPHNTSKELKILETKKKYYKMIPKLVSFFLITQTDLKNIVRYKWDFYYYSIEMQELAENINKSKSKSTNRKKASELEKKLVRLNENIDKTFRRLEEYANSIKECVVKLDKIGDTIKDENFIVKGNRIVSYSEVQISKEVLDYVKIFHFSKSLSGSLEEYHKELISIAEKAHRKAMLNYYSLEDVKKSTRNTALVFKDNANYYAFTDIFRDYYRDRL
jgi:hypothetical protein